jgi:hypothetical protein
MMVAAALDAMVTTRVKVASSNGRSWIRSARCQRFIERQHQHAGRGQQQRGDGAVQAAEQRVDVGFVLLDHLDQPATDPAQFVGDSGRPPQRQQNRAADRRPVEHLTGRDRCGAGPTLRTGGLNGEKIQLGHQCPEQHPRRPRPG